MERLNWHIADELGKRYSVNLMAPGGAANSGLPAAIEVNEVRLAPLPVFLLQATWQAIRIAWRQRPDVIFAGSGLTAPIAWLAGRLCGSKTIAYVHGLDITAPNIVYQHLWIPLLRRIDKIVANSRATAALATTAGIPQDRIEIIHPGVALPKLDPMARTRFRTAHGFGERPILLSVGRLTQRKGIMEFVRECMPTIVAAYPNCLLLIAGEAPKYALHSVNFTREDVHEAAQKSGLSDNVKILHAPSDDELSKIYQASDVHIFPALNISNNPEGFGMVAVEAAAHGLPTVAFGVGGIPDAVSDGVTGHLVEPGDYSRLTEMVIQTLAGPEEFNAEKCREFARTLNWSHFGEKLREACQALTHTSA